MESPCLDNAAVKGGSPGIVCQLFWKWSDPVKLYISVIKFSYLRFSIRRALLQFVLLLFTIGTFANAQWSFLGLRNKEVGDIKIFGDTIYAGTDDGIFKHSLSSMDTSWSPLGLQGKAIRTVLVLGGGEMFAVRNLWNTNDSVLVYKTLDGGGNWSATFTSSVTGSGNGTDNLFDIIDNHPGSGDTLYLIDVGVPAIYKTTTSGDTWQKVYDMQWRYRFIKVHSSVPGQLWFGGEGAIFNPILFTSPDYGVTWTMVDLGRVFEGDNACHTLMVDPTDKQTWYIPGEGKVVKTTDAGSTWNIILRNNFYDFDMAISPIQSNSLYVIGGIDLFRSNDAGVHWDTLSCPSVDSCASSFLDLEVKANGGSDIVIIGTGNGVYRYDSQPDAVDQTGSNVPSTFQLTQNVPNPFNPSTKIQFSISHSANVVLKIFDVLGIEIATLINEHLLPGRYSIVWDASAAATGIYFYRLQAGSDAETKKLVLVK